MGGCKKEGVASRDVHGRMQERAAARRVEDIMCDKRVKQ